MNQVQVLNLRLTDIAMLKIATTLWRHPDITQLLKCYISAYYCNDQMSPETKQLIEQTIFSKVDSLTSLPVPLKDNIKSICQNVGTNACSWLERCENKNTQLVKFVDHLQWDRTGCIDGLGTYRALYFSRQVKNCPTFISLLHDLYLTDCVNDYWSCISLYQKSSEFDKILGNRSQAVRRYWEEHIEGLSPEEMVSPILMLLANRAFKSLPFDNFQYFYDKFYAAALGATDDSRESIQSLDNAFKNSNK